MHVMVWTMAVRAIVSKQIPLVANEGVVVILGRLDEGVGPLAVQDLELLLYCDPDTTEASDSLLRPRCSHLPAPQTSHRPRTRTPPGGTVAFSSRGPADSWRIGSVRAYLLDTSISTALLNLPPLRGRKEKGPPASITQIESLAARRAWRTRS